MSDLEQQLLDLMAKDDKFDPAREELLRLQVTSEFKRKKRRLLIWYWVWHVVLIVILLPALNSAFAIFPGSPIAAHDPRLSDPGFLASAIVSETRAVTQGTAIAILVAAGLIVVKLWYWIVHSQMETMRELKRLELRWTLERRDAQPQQNRGG